MGNLQSGVFRSKWGSLFIADAVVRHLLSEDQSVIDSVIEHFGTELKNESGSIDRRALAKIVFQSKSDLEWLNRFCIRS